MDPQGQKQFNERLIEEFRVNGGKPPSLPTANLTLLTTIGRKSGEPRTVPLGYFEVDGEQVLIASNDGAAADPDWFANLVANPEIMVELAGESFRAEAVVLQGEERAIAFDKLAAEKTFFREHQQRAGRPIPVVIVKRLS